MIFNLFIGNTELIKSLIEAGVDPNAQDQNGQAAIFLALRKGDHFD